VGKFHCDPKHITRPEAMTVAETTTTDFEAITIGLASPAEIRSWSHGEVKKPETINYRTYKPERDGLFCERIFGPSRDWECHCGKYKKVKFKGIICDRCGVEVTRAKVRRERMGHIELAAPVCHSWYLKGVPSPISLLLDMSRRLLEEVIYFASYIVTDVDTDKLERRRADILSAVEAEKEEIASNCDVNIEALRERYEEGLRRRAERQQAEEAEESALEELPDLEAEEPEEFEFPVDEDEAILEDILPPAFAYATEPLPEIMSEEDLTRRIELERDSAKERIADLNSAVEKLFELSKGDLISELEYRRLTDLLEVCEKHLDGNFQDIFRAGLGAEAIRDLLADIDLDELQRELRKEIDERTGARRARAVKRLRIVEAFRKSKNRPEWMILEVIPVLPPELRPMVQLDGGRFATSDLNDLYRRVINRNNRLRRIMEINAPESIINHERRLLQEAVDALIDNSRRSRPVTGSNRRPLKSLSDMLKGKEGRFRKNLLGKRVDYSGRSVIVVGPELKLHQCGLPREMALELFKPFVMQRLVAQGHTTNIKTAKRMVDRLRPEVWDALEEVIEDHPVLLNRAPTLHRLGIQAFEPVLIDGKAIQLHPLCCEAFNADFDGDQMAVHVPLSAHAQAEARLLMLASRNLFKPADGAPITAPKYDIVLGCYYMTQESPADPGKDPKYFESPEAVASAYEYRKIDLHARVKVRIPRIYLDILDGDGNRLELDEELVQDLRRSIAINVTDEHPVRNRHFEFTVTDEMVHWASEVLGSEDVHRSLRIEPKDLPADKDERIQKLLEYYAGVGCLDGWLPVGSTIRAGIRREIIETTSGRVIFNSILPLDMQFINHDIAREELGRLVNRCYRIYDQARTAELLDTIKAIGFRFVTRSGLSICMNDTNVPTEKEAIISRAEREVRRINEAAAKGHILADEREQLVLEQWLKAREEIADQIMANIGRFNSIWMMTNSGARANRSHISQISGMRGLMSDPFGRLIEDMPVKNNFNDGLNVLEYFVSTHGARKGLADTALRTADAGYLTRRLVDVAQDVMIRAEDCGTTDGITVYPFYEHELHCPSCGQEDHHRTGTCHYCGANIPQTANNDVFETLQERIIGRTAAEDVRHPETGEIIVPAGAEITERAAQRITDAGIVEVTVRSPLTCELRKGICAKCYGRDLAHRRPVEIGTAVGIIAAQSIGEPGTQLTMRTFHTGGVAGEYITGVADVRKRKQQALRSLSDDIDQGLVSLDMVGGGGRARRKAIKEMLKVLETSVHGLLRVVELFEARTPKGQAITAKVDGVVAEIETKGLRTVVIHSRHSIDDLKTIQGERLAENVYAPDGKTLLAKKGQKLLKKVRARLRKAGVESVLISTSHLVPYRGELYVQAGTEVHAGDRLTAGPVDPQSILEMKGVRGVQDYLLREIQAVYRAQGVSINDKHIEVIIRQMLRKRKIRDHGDTKFLPGEIVDRFDFEDENRRIRELGGMEATADPILLGITQASLATESFLSAASFQRTTRVLTEAACEYRRDPLLGLKENVIIGRLIPAGSGMPIHRDRKIGFSDDVRELVQMPTKTALSEPKDAMEQFLQDLEAARDLGAPMLGTETGGDDGEAEMDEEGLSLLGNDGEDQDDLEDGDE
jgi:DNA-directed RNA polymerase subunit beta'